MKEDIAVKENQRVRNKVIHVHLTDEEKNLLLDKAKYCGMTYSEFIRQLIVTGHIIKYDFGDIKVVSKELNRIGKNINQVALVANSNGYVSPSDLELLQKQVEQIRNLVINNLMEVE